MDQSGQQIPQQWSPEPDAGGPQPPAGPADHQLPHYGPTAPYGAPQNYPQQGYPQPVMQQQAQYPQQPQQSYPVPPVPQQQYAQPPMPPQPYPQAQQPYPQQQQPYVPQQQYPQPPMPPQQYAQPPQQGYPGAPVPPQQYPQPPMQQPYPQQPYPQQPYVQQPYPPAPQPPQQPYVPQQQYAQAPPQQQPMPQQYPQPQQHAYVPPFGMSGAVAQAPTAPPQAAQPPQQPVAPQIPQQFSPSASQSSAQLPSPDQSGGAPVSFPPPANPPKVRDAFLNGARPFLQPGEQVFYGFILKLDSAIEETPEDFKIGIAGQHHLLGDVHRASAKINKGMKWAANPMDALNEKLTDKLTEKANDALFRSLAGPVFTGGWTSQAGWLVRYVRATAEDYGPGAYGAVTNQRYLVFRGARVGGSDMRLVYGIPRTVISGVRLENGKEALKHGRTPRAELHFSDGSMVATMMPGKQGEQLAAVLQPPAHG
ncbi:hypothetical protein KDL01_11545 [Actinospica durhamensis]|uniref:Uncharacterized protein n=1 Tax=Actinospica durhamensis TaxID=1508375 RepID=A0A941EMT3_9ACTN|nr:hypothetical protein [Actinospica durhamensis]MBR7833905.1 hypothetical protein [Actinospica durhamensis]